MRASLSPRGESTTYLYADFERDSYQALALDIVVGSSLHGRSVGNAFALTLPLRPFAVPSAERTVLSAFSCFATLQRGP